MWAIQITGPDGRKELAKGETGRVLQYATKAVAERDAALLRPDYADLEMTVTVVVLRGKTQKRV